MARETECQTPGTTFKILIYPTVIASVVELPFELDLDEALSRQLEINVHNALELVLAPFFVGRKPKGLRVSRPDGGVKSNKQEKKRGR